MAAPLSAAAAAAAAASDRKTEGQYGPSHESDPSRNRFTGLDGPLPGYKRISGLPALHASSGSPDPLWLEQLST